MNTTIGTRIYRGDISSVDDARDEYKKDPLDLTKLFTYITTLYSFRHIPHIAQELISRQGLLIAAARRLISHEGGISEELLIDQRLLRDEQLANKAETLLTHLFWLWQQKGRLSEEKREEVFKLVSDLIDFGRLRCGGSLVSAHTRLFIDLTELWMFIETKNVDQQEIIGKLDLIIESAGNVTAPDQKTRIYAKAGILYRKMGSFKNIGGLVNFARGYRIGLKATWVGNIQPLTRIKAYAALLPERLRNWLLK